MANHLKKWKPARRWFQYSLRSFLVVLTASAVWLSIVVNRARKQREAVEAIEALGGYVVYDWQVRHTVAPGATWLRSLIGAEYFQDVDVVYLDKLRTQADIRAAIPHLRRFRNMSILSPPLLFLRDAVLKAELNASLPACTRLREPRIIRSGPAWPAARPRDLLCPKPSDR